MSRLQDVLEATDPSTIITVCRVNLDNFSVINDGIGLSAGEFLLCAVAARLTELVAGERAMVARLATDDFAILIEERTERDLSQFAARINTLLCEPVYFGDQGIAVSANIGLVRRRAGGISAGELVRAANVTLHRAKRVGRGSGVSMTWSTTAGNGNAASCPPRYPEPGRTARSTPITNRCAGSTMARSLL